MIPTIHSPWYVVYKTESALTKYGLTWTVPLESVEYYQDPSEIETLFGPKKTAFIFTNLKSAARVANDNKACIRILFSKENATEFGVN